MRIGAQGEAGEESQHFFGRPVLFRCRLCGRVNIAGLQEDSREPWQEESALLQAQGLGLEGAWWFHTHCESCQPMERKLGAA